MAKKKKTNDYSNTSLANLNASINSGSISVNNNQSNNNANKTYQDTALGRLNQQRTSNAYPSSNQYSGGITNATNYKPVETDNKENNLFRKIASFFDQRTDEQKAAGKAQADWVLQNPTKARMDIGTYQRLGEMNQKESDDYFNIKNAYGKKGTDAYIDYMNPAWAKRDAERAEQLKIKMQTKAEKEYQQKHKELEEQYAIESASQGFENSSQYRPSDDLDYEYINGNVNAKAKVQNDAANLNRGYAGYASAKASENYLTKYRKLDLLNENEKALYNHLFNTYGKDSANEYLEHIDSNLNERLATAQDKQITDVVGDSVGSEIGASALSLITNVGGGITGVPTIAYKYLKQKITGEPIDPNDPDLFGTRLTGTIRNKVAEDIYNSADSEGLGELGVFAYQTGMSMADNLFQIAIGGGLANPGSEIVNNEAENVVLGIMGASASSQSMIDQLKEGSTADRAVITGLLAGGIEVFTEKIGMDNLFKSLAGGRGVFESVIKGMIPEGLEEGLSDVLNWYFDGLYASLFSMEQSGWEKTIQQYIDSGMSEGEATTQAFLQYLKELTTDIGGGMVSGGLLGGSFSAAANINFSNQNTKTQADRYALVQEGLENDVNSKSFENASKIAQKYEETGKVSKIDAIRQLYQNREDARTNYVSDADVRRALVEAGLKEDIDSEAYNVAEKLQRKIETKGDISEKEALMQLDANENTKSEFAKSISGEITEETNNEPSKAESVSNGKLESVIEFATKLGVGEQGLKSMEQIYDGEQDAASFNKDMLPLYNAGRNGVPFNEAVNKAKFVTQQSDLYAARLMYQSGVYDNEIEKGEINGREENISDNEGRDSYVDSRESIAELSRRTGATEGALRRQRSRAESRTTPEALGQHLTNKEFNISDGKKYEAIELSHNYNDNETTDLRSAAESLGVNLILTSGNIKVTTPDGKSHFVRGMNYIDNNGKRVIVVNAADPIFTATKIFSHEQYHNLKKQNPDLNKQVKQDLINNGYAGKELTKLLKTYADLYKKNKVKISDEDLLEEIFADAYAGMDTITSMLTMSSGARVISKEVREAVKKHANINEHSGTIDESENNVKESRKTKTDINLLPDGKGYGNVEVEQNRYYDQFGKEVVVITPSDFFDINDMKKEDVYRIVENELRKLEGQSVIVKDNGREIFFDSTFPSEYTRSEDTQRTYGNAKSAKMKAAYRIKNLVQNAVYKKHKTNIDTAKRVDKSGGIDFYNVEFAIPKIDGSYTLFKGTLLVRIDKTNKNFAYDITEVRTKKEGIILHHSGDPGLTSELTDEFPVPSSDGMLSQPKNNIKQKFSMVLPTTDSLGNKLSKQQQTYFKHSKVRDENGNLLVVYHGTNENFTVFDAAKSRTNMDIQGMFFSPWDIDASGYGENVGAYYLNITNPAPESVGYKALNKFKGQNNAGQKAREYLISQGYDGVNNGNEEYIAFYPEQIKKVENFNPTSNPDIRFSQVLDSDGNKLSENQVELFKDSQVRDYDGNLLRMYHGTNEEFNVFKANEFIKEINGVSKVKGYFSTSEDYASIYGDTTAYYLNIKNPLQIDDDSKTLAEWKTWFAEQGVKNVKFDSGIEQDSLNGYVDTDGIRYYGKWELFDDGGYWVGDGNLTEQIEKAGYDGIYWHEGEDEYTLDLAYMPFNENAIKRADNLNPTDNPDISYSRVLEVRDAIELAEQNEKLKAQVRELQQSLKKQTARAEHFKAELHPAERPMISDDAAKSLANDLIEKYTSTLKSKGVAAEIKSIARTLFSGDIEETWAESKARALMLAHDLIESSKETVPDELQEEIIADIRRHPFKITERIKSDIADYNLWRKAHFGILKLYNSEKTNIDDFYQDLRTNYPWLPDIANPSDQLMYMAELVDNYEVKTFNPYTENLDDYTLAFTIEELAGEIVANIVDAEQTKLTFADKKNNQIRELKKKYSEKAKENLAKYKERRDKEYQDLKDKYANQMAKKREEAKRKDLISKISSHSSKLATKLLRPTDKQHIPERFKTSLATLLSAINTESVYRNEDGKITTGAITKKTQAFEQLKEELRKLGPEYIVDPDLLGSDDLMIRGELDEVLSYADKSILEMSVPELQRVWKILVSVEATINSVNKMFSQGRWEYVSDLADALYHSNIGKDAHNTWRLNKLQDLLTIDMYTPEAYFHRMGDVGDYLFRMLRDSQDNAIRMQKQVADYKDKNYKDADYQKLEKEVVEVVLAGRKVKMSVAQLMELYVLSKRDQGRQHLFTGGIVVSDFTDGKKRYTMAIPTGAIAPDELSRAFAKLTSEQIRVAEALQWFASNTLAGWGNDTSMRVYGYKKFNETSYWRIKTREEELRQEIGIDRSVTSPANKGMTKLTNPNATTSVVIQSIFDTFTEHTTEMITYAAWLESMEDLNRIRNFKKGTNIADMLNHVFGKGGAAYLQKLMTDLSNGSKSEKEYFSKFIGNFKAASVGTNLRVIFQQPTAILRALDMIDPKYLVGGAFAKQGWEKAKKYSPIAQWKDWGYFDTNTGRQSKDIFFNNSNAIAKAKEIAMKPAGFADSLAWGQLWNAVELETKDKHSNLKVGSEEFYKAVAKRFAEIIDRTQVVDGVLQRSQIMRNKSGLVKMATAFMAEPMKQYNMILTSAYDCLHNKGKALTAAKHRMVRTCFAFLAAGIVNAVVQSIVDAIRNSNRDKKYWEKWLEAMTGITGDEESGFDKLINAASGNLGSVINPAMYIPYIKDVWSLIQGYEVDRMDMSAISDTIKSAETFVKALGNRNKNSVVNASINFASQMGKLLGVPVYNIKRDTFAIIDTIANESNNYAMQYDLAKFQYNMNYSANKSKFTNILADAKENDTEAYNYIRNDLIRLDKFATDSKTTEAYIDSSVKGIETKKEKETSDYQLRYTSMMYAVENKPSYVNLPKYKQQAIQSIADQYVRQSGSDYESAKKHNFYNLGQAKCLEFKAAIKYYNKGEHSQISGEDLEMAIRSLGLSQQAMHNLWLDYGRAASKNPF